MKRPRYIGLRNLSSIVAKYYLANPHTFKIIEGMLGNAGEPSVQVNEAAMRYLSMLSLDLAVKHMTEAIKRAINDYAIGKEFRSERGREVLGVLDISRTVVTYPSLYSYLTYVPSNAIPEYAMLRRMAIFVKRTACESTSSTAPPLDDQARQDNPLNILLRKIMEKMRSNCVVLSRKINELPRATGLGELPSYVRLRGPYLPPWFHAAYKAYSVTRRIRRRPNYEASMRRGFEGKDFVLLGWRLYELFIMLLVLDVFTELGYSAVLNDNYVKLTREGEIIRLLFNRQLDSSIIESVDGDGEIAGSIRGRPDVSIDKNSEGGRLIVIDGKFSRSPAYITAGRFKVMAYMYEYNADLGVVVFPGLDESRKYDEEEEATVKLWMNMRSKGYSEIVLKNGKRIYMVKLDPGESEDPGLVWRSSRKTLEELLGKHITG